MSNEILYLLASWVGIGDLSWTSSLPSCLHIILPRALVWTINHPGMWWRLIVPLFPIRSVNWLYGFNPCPVAIFRFCRGSQDFFVPSCWISVIICGTGSHPVCTSIITRSFVLVNLASDFSFSLLFMESIFHPFLFFPFSLLFIEGIVHPIIV